MSHAGLYGIIISERETKRNHFTMEYGNKGDYFAENSVYRFDVFRYNRNINYEKGGDV